MFWLALLFTIAILPWLIPVAIGVRVVTGVMTVLVLGTVFGPAFFAIDGPIQFSLDRFVWAALMVVVAMRMMRRTQRFDQFNRIDAIVFGLVAWTLVNCVVFGMTGEGQPSIARWLFYCAIPFTMYLVCRLKLPDHPDAPGCGDNDSGPLRDTVEPLISMVLVLGTYLSLTSVMEMMDLRSLIFPKFINDPKIWEFYGRGRGPLLNPAGNGVVMTVGLAACVIRFFQSGRYGKAIYAGLALIALAGCYATLTRSVWLGAAMTLAVLGMFYIPIRIRVLGLMMIVVFGGALTIGLKEQLMAMKRDKALSAAEAAKSVELRPLLATVAFEMFKDKPIMGHGYGHYYENSEPYHAIRRYGIPLEKVRPYMQHNVFLSILVDLGLIGLSLHVLLLFSLFCTAWRLACHHGDGSPQRSIAILMIGLLCGYTINGCFHEVAIIEMMHMFLFTIAGLTVTIASQFDFHRSPSVQNSTDPVPSVAMTSI